MKSIVFRILPVFILICAIVFSYFYIVDQYSGVPKDSPMGKYQLEIENGDNLNSIGQKLARDKVINSADWFWLASNITSISPVFRSGVYVLELPASKEDILKQLEKQLPVLEVGITSISLLEGDTAEDIADKLSKSGVIEPAEFLKYIQDPSNFKDSKYQFLPKANSNCIYGELLKKCPKYYLEGYLFPDTYEFFLNSTPEKVVNKFLENFNRRVWETYKSKLDSKGNIEDLERKLILASVIEREVGRNYVKAILNNTDLQVERQTVAGVFLNRVAKKMKWQSDATVWYGVDRKRGVAVDGRLNWGDPKYNTGYNTYVTPSYPVGAISNPGLNSLKAAFEPKDSEYLFFVSDRSGKTYFAVTNSQHEANIQKVREINQSLPSI
jgi:UPF0755 protein